MEPYRRKVRYWDVDANSHVFNARYLVYVDDALTDYLEEAGFAFDTHAEDGYLLVLARTEIDYRSEATIGDVLLTMIDIDKIGTTSIVFSFRITDEATGRLVAAGREVYVSIDTGTRRPIPVPEEIRRLTA